MARTISRARRNRVFARDGYRCQNCQGEFPVFEDADWRNPKSRVFLVLDHIMPVSRGGSNVEGNLRTLCSSCNSSRGARPVAYLKIRSAVRSLTPIMIYPALAKMLGLKEGVFLSRLLYWSAKSYLDGWVYKSADEWQEETTLTYKEQTRVRDQLSTIIEERYDRVEHRMYYRPIPDAVADLFAAWDQSDAINEDLVADEHLTKSKEPPDQREEEHLTKSKEPPDQREDRESNKIQQGILTKGPSTTLSGTPDATSLPARNGRLKNHADSEQILAFLNHKAGRNYQPVAVNLALIEARLREGATVDHCRAVIGRKCAEWLGDPKMVKYLRPATLFNRTHFAQYQGELPATAFQPEAQDG